MAKGMSSMASAAFSKTLASAELTSCRRMTGDPWHFNSVRSQRTEFEHNVQICNSSRYTSEVEKHKWRNWIRGRSQWSQMGGEPSYLEEPNDCNLVVCDHRLHFTHGSQGGDCGACSLLQPVYDVICLPARCAHTEHNHFSSISVFIKTRRGRKTAFQLWFKTQELQIHLFLNLNAIKPWGGTQIWLNFLSSLMWFKKHKRPADIFCERCLQTHWKWENTRLQNFLNQNKQFSRLHMTIEKWNNVVFKDD